MKIKLTAEERANVYAFVGGLTYIPSINREGRRRLTRLALKFKLQTITSEADEDGNTTQSIAPNNGITLNQNNLFYLITLLDGAIINGDKAKLNSETTAEQRENIDKVNTVFDGILKKIRNKQAPGKSLDKAHLGMVLGAPILPKEVTNE